MLLFTLHSSLLVSLHVYTSYKHSFASLIDKQLSRKATLMFQDVLLFELFQRTLPNPLLFSFKSTQKFSRQNLSVRKKAYCPLTVLGRQYTFFQTSQQPISMHHNLKTSLKPLTFELVFLILLLCLTLSHPKALP